MKRRRRLRRFPPQLRPELQLPSELSETLSSDTQVVAAPPDPVRVVVWVVAVVAVVVAVVDAAAVAARINRTKGGDNNAKRERFWKKRLWILQTVSIASDGIDTYGNSVSMGISMVPKRWIHGLL